MKLGTVFHQGLNKVVAVKSETELVDMSDLWPDMVALVEGGPDALDQARARLNAPQVLHTGTQHEQDGDSYTETTSAVLRTGAAWPWVAS